MLPWSSFTELAAKALSILLELVVCSRSFPLLIAFVRKRYLLALTPQKGHLAAGLLATYTERFIACSDRWAAWNCGGFGYDSIYPLWERFVG
jgi:hypothetical protein